MFGSDFREALKKAADRGFGSVEERDAMLTQLSTAEGLKARDVMWMLFRPDRPVRDAGAKLIQRLKDPETVDLFLGEARGKPDVAMRGAVPSLFALALPGLERRLADIVVKFEEKPTPAVREMQSVARRILLEAPVSKQMEPILWELADAGTAEERLPYIAKLVPLPIDDKVIARWQKLAKDEDPAIREKALEVLAANVTPSSAGILVAQLPTASYALQQAIIAGLTRLGSAAGPQLLDQLLPLITSGDAGIRTTVVKILMGFGDPGPVIRRYLEFSKSLAGFVRERALESLRVFGDALIEPVIALLSDPDPEIRSAAVAIAGAFHDPRIVPATIPLLKDEDWWIRLAAADTLGNLKDPRAVDALVAALADPEAKWSAVEALGKIGDMRALPPLGRLLGDPKPEVRIAVAEALHLMPHTQVLQALTQMATNDPDRNVKTRVLDLIDAAAKNAKGPATDLSAIRAAALVAQAAEGGPRLNTYLIATRNQGGSDFHLSVGQPPIIRMAADLTRAQAEPLTAAQTEAMIKEVLTPAQWEALQAKKQIDFSYYIPQGGRYRANVFLDHKGYSAVFRVIAEKPPTIYELGMPAQLAEIADYHQGLVIICGPAGSGKSTTLAAFVNLFNETHNAHVLTMEDPVEFVHPFKNSLINQREIGTHTQSFARALRAALREDPDVIVIGELRDNESVLLALTAAETGHIVLGTLSSTSAPKAIDRIISSFTVDQQPQIRASLSESLKYIIAQRLLPAKQGRKQVAVFEVLKGTPNIANMIRDEKTYQIYSAMQIGKNLGMQTFDEALRDLVKRGEITGETAYMAALKKEDFESMVTAEFLKASS